MKLLRLCLVFASALVAAALAQENPSKPQPKTYTAAIFVTNSAGPENDAKLEPLEDYVTSGVTDLGVSVISRQTALNAVQGIDPDAKENALDQQLAQNASAVRLAQALGADYLLQVSLSGLGSKKNAVNAYGVKSINDERTVRVSYKILDGNTGASLTADTVKASRTVQTTANATEDNQGVWDDLLAEAGQKVAASLKNRIDRGRIAAPTATAGLVSITITTEVADLVIPDVRIGVENTVTISQSKFKVSPLSATVEVDGFAVGSAPGTIEVRPGLHKLRVTREGFAPWERTVNFTKGLTLNVAMTMSDEGYARWQDATAFLNVLKNGAKLTDAEVKVLEGQAKMLEQSGFRVNTKEGITIKQNSIFN